MSIGPEQVKRILKRYGDIERVRDLLIELDEDPGAFDGMRRNPIQK